MLDQLFPVRFCWPFPTRSNVSTDDAVLLRHSCKRCFEKFLDVGPGRVTVEIAQDNSVSLEASANVLFDSTGNEDSERDGRMFFEEVENVIDEFLHPSLILALVKTVDDDEERSLGEGLPKSASIYNSQERGEDQAIQLCSQRHVVGEQA